MKQDGPDWRPLGDEPEAVQSGSNPFEFCGATFHRNPVPYQPPEPRTLPDKVVSWPSQPRACPIASSPSKRYVRPSGVNVSGPASTFTQQLRSEARGRSG